MLSPMAGEEVAVRRPSRSRDACGVESTSWGVEAVAGVLVADEASVELSAGIGESGKRSRVQLAFPKGFAGSLRGCEVEVRGRRYRVVGDPLPYPDGCPTRWNRLAHAESIDT